MSNKKKKEITIRSSAAEYLTYVASVGDSEDSLEGRYEDENIYNTKHYNTDNDLTKLLGKAIFSRTACAERCNPRGRVQKTFLTMQDHNQVVPFLTSCSKSIRMGTMEYKIPSQDEIRSRKVLFDKYQEAAPWHAMGDRVVQQLTKSAKPYACRFKDLPQNFFESVMDQYLAVLWHKGGNREDVTCGQPWLYHSFIVMKSLSGDFYRCCDETGTEFTLFSHSVTIGIEQENRRLFLTALLDMGGWFMTYGPVLGWKGFGDDDFKYLAKYVAAQMYRNSGLSAVIQSNPLPFWAAFIMAEIPPVYHKDKFSEWYSLSGIFKDGKLPVLPRTWKREEKGIWLRLVYSKEDIFRRRCIYYNTKTGAALLSAGDADSFNKTVTAAGHGFDAQHNEPEAASMAMVSFVQDLLKKTPEYFRLEKIFDN